MEHDKYLLHPIAPGTNFMLHRVFCCIAEKITMGHGVFLRANVMERVA